MMNKLEQLIEENRLPFSRYLAQAKASETEIKKESFPGFEKITLQPDNPDSWVLIAGCLVSLGSFEQAIDAYRTALEIDPTSSYALHGLANIGCLSINSKEIEMLRLVANDQEQSIRKRAAANFTLGQLYDSNKHYDIAFNYFKIANETTQQLDPNPPEMQIFADQITETIRDWTAEVLASKHGWGSRSDIPVFVVGMPRSGTTLVEQIVASHPNAFGAGERTDLSKVVNLIGLHPDSWDENTLRLASMGHLSRLKVAGGPALHIVDKMPDNIFWLGIIASMFPRSKIVICHRDIHDVSLSCYFQNFGSGLSWTCDLDKIVFRARETERIIQHWTQVIPVPILDIHYENFVSNIEEESRRLINFIGLDWDPACLAFHETKRQILTASVWQVRQPAYKSSVGKWQRYKHHIQPFFDGT